MRHAALFQANWAGVMTSSQAIVARSMSPRRWRWGLLVVLLALGGPTGRSDEFILNSGGRVEGELLNPNQSPRTTYVVRIGPGNDITLNASQVRQAELKSPAERETERAYEQWLLKMPATAEGNWKMAEWCRRYKLRDREQFHLSEVVRLDPDHQQARTRLGYRRIDGEWVKPGEFQRQQGYELARGRYRVRQDVEAIERRERQELERKQWRRTIKRMIDSLRKGRRADTAREQLAAIRDPAAVPALSEVLAGDGDPSLKSLCIDVLGRIEGSAATTALVVEALQDPDPELRLQCLDQLQRRHDPSAVQAFITALGSHDNARINRAALGLEQLGDASAIPYLINVLTTKHVVLQSKGNPGQIGAIFPRGGSASGGLGGLSIGARPRRVDVVRENRAVLNALVALSRGTNYRFDKNRWRQWYVDSNTPAVVSLRRSE